MWRSVNSYGDDQVNHTLTLLYELQEGSEMAGSTVAVMRTANTPSPQILRAAKSAASSPHALINLTRLVKSLDAKIPASEPGDSPLVDLSGLSAVQRRKDWEVSYPVHLLGQAKLTY